MGGTQWSYFFGNGWNYYKHPDENPYDESPLEFDPLYGYPEGARQKKEMRFTFAEMESLQPPPEYRDYCFHKVVKWKQCQYENLPWSHRCYHIWHEYANCANEELKDRLKDYEREKRLLKRRARILKKQAEMRAQEKAQTLKA